MPSPAGRWKDFHLHHEGGWTVVLGGIGERRLTGTESGLLVNRPGTVIVNLKTGAELSRNTTWLYSSTGVL